MDYRALRKSGQLFVPLFSTDSAMLRMLHRIFASTKKTHLVRRTDQLVAALLKSGSGGRYQHRL